MAREEAAKTDKYTAESIENLKAVIAEAEKVYNSEEATQEQVNEQIVLLEKGIEALEESKPEPKPVDKGVLEQKLSAAKKEEAVKTDKYTAESIENLNAVIAEAEKVYNSEEATQEQVNEQIVLLEKGIEALEESKPEPEPKPVDKGVLEQKLSAAKKKKRQRQINIRQKVSKT